MNTLIQCAHGRAYERLIECSRAWHAKTLPDWDHQIFIEPRGERPPTWNKCRRIHEALQRAHDGDLIVYLDCDAIIRMKITAALHIAMTGCDFAAVENAWSIFNGGMMIWEANARTRRCVSVIERQGPDALAPAQEQDTIDFYVRRQLRCKALPPNWNHYQHARGSLTAEPIYISAWHGLGAAEALFRMEAELAKLSSAA